MWIDLLASGPQEGLAFTVRLSEVGETGRIKMPVAVTGSWVHPANGRKIVVTTADLQTAKSNFLKKSSGEINVDYDHASEMPNFVGGARPSAGRVLALAGPEPYTDSRGARRQILWGNYEPTPMARTMIRNREYRYISPVLARERLDKGTGEVQGITITTIALTNTPVMEEMPQIFASERGQPLRCAEVEWPERWQPQRSAASQNADETLTRMAKERAAKDAISYEDALKKVCHENPELAIQAREAVTMDAPTQHGRPKRTASDELAKRATARARENGTDYQTALSEVHREDPALARLYRKQIDRDDD